MNEGIIVCTRKDSTRLPNKCFRKINGVTILEHLHRRLVKCNIPIVYAYPENEVNEYYNLLYTFKNKDFLEYRGFKKNPIQRMYNAAKAHNLDIVVRITHDKIFIDHNVVNRAVDIVKNGKYDYVYSSSFIDGMGFEVFTIKALENAIDKYPDRDIEHITYALKSTSHNQYNMDLTETYRSDVRLLIDYPEDEEFFTALFSSFGNDISIDSLMDYMNTCHWIKTINKLPLITVYTCAYNACDYIFDAMKSVRNQNIFNEIEYILIDDYSKDRTPLMMAYFSSQNTNTKFYRNNENMGLSSSSNFALSRARGKYIIRLDADDYFTNENVLSDMYKYIKSIDSDVIYPDNYFGNMNIIQKGSVCNHVGGALFKKSALDHLRFTDGLRNFEGLDLWHRAKNELNISYYEKPTFFYRQHDDSMSKTNLELRDKTKKQIESMYL